MNLSLLPFKSIIRHTDLPFDYSMFGFNKWLRYPATIYGYVYDKDNSNYNLWLTLGLKRNIAIPFGYFYIANKFKSNVSKNINIKS